MSVEAVLSPPPGMTYIDMVGLMAERYFPILDMGIGNVYWTLCSAFIE